MKPKDIEERGPLPQSPVAVAKATEDVTAPTTYSHSPLILALNSLPAPTTDQPKRRVTKPNASSSSPRNPLPTKKKTAPPAAKEAYQSGDGELAIPVSPVPIPFPSTRKSKHPTTAKPAPTKRQGSAKPVDNGAVEVQPITKKKNLPKLESRWMLLYQKKAPRNLLPLPWNYQSARSRSPNLCNQSRSRLRFKEDSERRFP